MKKTTTTNATVLLIILSIAFTLVVIPTVNAHTPPWQVTTFAYIHVSPNPVGVGQEVTVVFWLDQLFDGVTEFNDYRFHNFKLTITKPDDKIETMTWDVVQDPTSSQYTRYTPDQAGKYTFEFTFPGQDYNTYSHNPNSAYVNDTYKASSASTTLTVQEEPVPGTITYPLPTEYWTRPIEGENWDWYTISSNWLGYPQIVANIQPDGIAPNSPHIMWTKPLQFGGVVGGTNTGTNGTTYYTGLSYETKFNPVIILNGRLYYPLPKSNNGAVMYGSALNNGFACVDLRTGEQIFWQNTTMPSFGQLVDIEDMDQHGVIPNGYLWQVSGTTWNALDPLDGNWLFSVTNVPSGTSVYGPNGEILIYTLNANAKMLTLWNSTATIGTFNIAMSTYRPVGKVINSTQKGNDAYSWKITAPWLPAGAIIDGFFLDDILLGHNGTLPSAPGARSPLSSAPWTMWAMSLKPESRGQMIWMKTYTAPPGDVTLVLGAAGWPAVIDPVTRVFCITVKETDQWYGYSLDTGDKLWGPVGDFDSFQYYGGASGGVIPLVSLGNVAYGNLYVAGYGGEIVAFDLKTGNEVWRYNNTYSGFNTVYGRYPVFISSIADGKIYAHTSEHSPNAPLYKGARMRCINATTGEEIWTMLGWNTFTPYGSYLVEPVYVADGYISYLNVYDMQIYTLGKGPSATTVAAGPKVSTHGNSVLVEGTVIDIAAGTKQDEQAARFPYGVPVVSDASMGEWMEYVYMQKPRPTNATGVEVIVSVVDPNNNCYEVGRTTSDADGFFKLSFTPEVPGEYIITAAFEGSESYWGSHAKTAINVEEAPAATPEPTPTPASIADQYFLPMSIGTIVAIIAVLALLVLILVRKK
jgi:hypothetical protein